MKRYVIIGGGIAGTTAAEALRGLDAEADITVIGEEDERLYSRVLLPHYIKGKVEREKVYLKKPDWYETHNITYQSGVFVSRIDVKNRFVATSESREIPYDALLVTTGGEVNLFDEDLRGVSYFRTLADADQLVKLIGEVKTLPKDEQKVAVYGGGFIALEYMNMFAHEGFDTTLLMRGIGFWSRMLSDVSQDVLLRYAKAQGVTVQMGVKDVTFVGDKELSAVVFDGETVPARILGVGIGIHTEKALLKDAGIEVEAGVVANEFLETNVKNVYTAGDVAEFYDTIVDRRLVAGNWMNAIMQGRTVAKTMHGERTAFALVSSYATNLLGKEIVFVGDTSRAHAEMIVQQVADEENAIELFERDGKTVGAILIGNVTTRQAITNAIKQKERYVA